ncbi:MAG: hypothetical protein U1D55_03430 [Phycisphaerae bacterium]
MLAFLAASVSAQTPTTQAQPRAAAPGALRPAETRARAIELIDNGARFLVAQQENEGGWAGKTGPGISALCVKALAQARSVGSKHDAVLRGVAFVLRSKRDDGGVYSAAGMLKNYESSVALSALCALKPPDHEAEIAKLRQFLLGFQYDESEDKSADDVAYGGAGYGLIRRPDLSNTQMMVEALHDSGLPPDHPAYKKALAFIQRCQMLGEFNDQPFARGASDGGFIYTPTGGGESKAGSWVVDGKKQLRSYGSMTYAGFKSMLYAGLKPDDPRVTAAVAWIGRYWTLDFNPNMPEKQSREGLYYYYHVFARALDALGQDEITDAAGRKHDWRLELVDKLASLQKADGSWVNEEDRWWEGQPPLTTAYAMLALEAAFPAPLKDESTK